MSQNEEVLLRIPALSTEDLVELERLLLGDSQRKARRKAVTKGTANIVYAVVFPTILALDYLNNKTLTMLSGFILCMTFVCHTMFGLSVLAKNNEATRAASARLRESLSYLTHCTDARAPALLSLAYFHPANPAGQLHRERLLLALPALTDDEATHFQKPHRETLHRLLLQEEREMRVAALHALAKVGDRTTFAHTAALRDSVYWEDGAFREVCERCEATIEARETSRHHATNLLRSSDAPTGQATLLRSVGKSPAQEDEADVLLRPGD